MVPLPQQKVSVKTSIFNKSTGIFGSWDITGGGKINCLAHLHRQKTIPKPRQARTGKIFRLGNAQ